MTISPEDAYLKRILERQNPKVLEIPEEDIRGIYFFAKAIDKYGKYHYLSADSEEAIESYCEGGIISDSMAICNWINYVDPIQICFHFKWVGKRHNPFVVAKPFKYQGSTKWTP